jgi:GH25 family lysozyme M1 (1,4-beta-N-acetylmuramidase)
VLSRFDRWLNKYDDTAHAGYVPEDKVKAHYLLPYPALIEPLHDCIFVDISKWQGEIDFNRMKAAGIKGVMMKAGQGTVVDPKFEVNYFAARTAGLLVGMYWYFDSRATPYDQARAWAILVNKYGYDLVCAFDYEENYGGRYGGIVNLSEFIRQFQIFTNVPDIDIVIYTGFFYWSEHGSNNSMWARFQLWLAWYGNEQDVRIPQPWTHERLWGWQFTDHGDGWAFGVESREIDLNFFVKGLMVFEALYGETGEVPPPAQETGMYKVWSESHNMSLRQGASVSDTRIILIPVGTIMTADILLPQTSGGIPGDKWAHVTRVVVGGTEYSGYVAIVHNGETLCRYEVLPESGANPKATVILTDDSGQVFEGTAELLPK